MNSNADWRGQGLPQDQWPLSDQAEWQALFREGDIFDGMGTAVAWKERTRDTNVKHYGHWLGWLTYSGQLDTDVRAWDRVQEDSVRALSKNGNGACSFRHCLWAATSTIDPPFPPLLRGSILAASRAQR